MSQACGDSGPSYGGVRAAGTSLAKGRKDLSAANATPNPPRRSSFEPIRSEVMPASQVRGASGKWLPGDGETGASSAGAPQDGAGAKAALRSLPSQSTGSVPFRNQVMPLNQGSGEPGACLPGEGDPRTSLATAGEDLSRGDALKEWSCSVCWKTFGSAKALSRHKTSVHSRLGFCFQCKTPMKSNSFRAHGKTCGDGGSVYFVAEEGLENMCCGFVHAQSIYLSTKAMVCIYF